MVYGIADVSNGHCKFIGQGVDVIQFRIQKCVFVGKGKGNIRL